MRSLFKKGVDLHKQLHEHVFARRTDINDVSQARVGQPIDVTIKFIQASGIPKMDPGPHGLADPYFIANIDGKTSYVSTAQRNTLSPVWNEFWMVAHVPSDARLRVDVYDKDEGRIVDDYVGSFTVRISDGAQVETLKGMTGNDKGVFGFQITSEPSQHTNIPQYSFNGPIRYSRHFSPTAGSIMKLSNSNGSLSRLWSTWKIPLKGIPIYFEDHHQHWNVHYKAAQTIFQGPLSFTMRAPIEAGHRMLYARTTSNTFGIINDSEGFWALFRAGDDRLPTDPLLAQQKVMEEWRIKPAVYTYIIGEDDNFRFSETGASFFVDFASKHALHSCCSETVRYSGEFHPRPVYPDGSGWTSFSEETKDCEVEWELVIDNNSGTYAPDKNLLPALKGLFEYNFPGLKVVAWDYKDNEAELDASRKACREYALKNRGVTQGQLRPSQTFVDQCGATSLFNAASNAQSANVVEPDSTSSEPPSVAQHILHVENTTPDSNITVPSAWASTVPAGGEPAVSSSQQPQLAGPIRYEPPRAGTSSTPISASVPPSTSIPEQPPVPDGPPPPYEEGSWIPQGMPKAWD